MRVAAVVQALEAVALCAAAVAQLVEAASGRSYQASSAVGLAVTELIAEGRPFTETVTTTRYMMTTAMMTEYAFFDSEMFADATIADFHDKAQFVRISSAGLRESHVHDVTITRESPNYPGGV